MSIIFDELEKITVRSLMRTDVIKINSDSPVGDAAKIMLRNEIHGMPVVNNKNEDEVLKVVTSYDLLGITYYGRFSEDTDYIKTTKVIELTKDQVLISTTPDSNIGEVLKAMAEHSIAILPVIEDNKMIGIISITNIVRKLLTL